jgi:hypothetical protein
MTDFIFWNLIVVDIIIFAFFINRLYKDFVARFNIGLLQIQLEFHLKSEPNKKEIGLYSEAEEMIDYHIKQKDLISRIRLEENNLIFISRRNYIEN